MARSTKIEQKLLDREILNKFAWIFSTIAAQLLTTAICDFTRIRAMKREKNMLARKYVDELKSFTRANVIAKIKIRGFEKRCRQTLRLTLCDTRVHLT